MENKRVFSFDAETNGLWGNAFSIGAVLWENGKETKTWVGRCPIKESLNPWVADNVIPQIQDIKITHDSYEPMLKSFSEFYLKNKQDADIIVHMGVPVESQVIRDMHRLGFIGDWDAPFPLIDISGNLKQAGFDPTSVDAYNTSHGIAIQGNAHNPLYDSRAAVKCYYSLMGGLQNVE